MVALQSSQGWSTGLAACTIAAIGAAVCHTSITSNNPVQLLSCLSRLWLHGNSRNPAQVEKACGP
jgi:hypothetical protein